MDTEKLEDKMNSHEQILSFMDLLDLDEELIDARLKAIMDRNSYTNKHLKNAIYLLQYKNMITLQEESECENDEECTFVAKLLADIHKENIDNVCKIVNIVLGLNKGTVVAKSEHFVQQILSNFELPSKGNVSEGDSEDECSLKALLNLKLCDSILDTVLRNNKKLTLPFLETPLENVLTSTDDKLKIYFLNKTVPKLFEGIVGYNILDRIWNYVKQFENNDYSNALKILSCLSEFYLPVADDERSLKFESEIICHYEFWNILLNGLMSDDPASRKISVYLIKRSIDCLTTQKKDVQISSETNIIFNWTRKDTQMLKDSWNNFFILIDSLEEKQSNIVLPSLHLFDSIKCIDSCWMNCAFNIGLKHDNTQVRVRCIEYRLKTKIRRLSDATVLLDAFNDINLFDHPKDSEDLRNKIAEAFEDVHSLACILKVIPHIKWSPVPLYHLSEVLALKKLDLSSIIEHAQLSSIVIEILKIPCNNLSVRHAAKMNVTYFVGNCCKSFQFEDFINIYPLLGWVKNSAESFDQNPFICAIQDLKLNPDEKDNFFRILCKSHENIDLGLIYLKNHTDYLNAFMKHVDEKIKKIQDINNRQYSKKTECLNDVIYVTHLFSKTRKYFKDTINTIISEEYETITSYVFSLVQENDIIVSIEDINLLFKGFQSMAEIKNDQVKQKLLEMYRQMIIVLTAQNVQIEKKLYAIFIIELVTRQLYTPSDKHRIFSLKQILHVMQHAKINETTNVIDIGRFRNAFYEKSCAIVRNYLEPEDVMYEDMYSDESDFDDLNTEKLDFIESIWNFRKKVSDVIKENIKDLIDFVEHVIECGGYGCLKWILKIMFFVLPEVLDNEEITFNNIQFIDRMWKETEELKTNSQYSDCIREFARLITLPDLLKRAMFNNILIIYCNKILEYGSLSNSALHSLVNEFQTNILITEDLGHVICVLCDILLFSPVPKKDQRIADNVAICIQQSSKFEWWRLSPYQFDVHFNSDIQTSALYALTGIKHPAIFETIASTIISKVENHFKAKDRYHGKSQSHRLLLLGLQHLLFLPLLNQDILESETVASWVIDLLGKLPHQPSVKICLQWFISLRFYVKNKQLDETVVEMMKSKNIPLTSQFMILYWTLTHKILMGVKSQEEFEFVMDFLLSHTMGQMFNIRLHAQYLATEIFNIVKLGEMEVWKYRYTIEIIQKTFVESAKDKNFMRLKEDFFVNDFNIVEHYTPLFIYYFLPRYCEVFANEDVCRSYLEMTCSTICKTELIINAKTELKKEWLKLKRPDEEIFKYQFRNRTESSRNFVNSHVEGTIQKKYIPWKNMSDVNMFETEKKKEATGELIMVASLIDKLPNLGGMARTSEVFGVKTYVVDSLRHLQDKTFQGLSVSAERWVNIEEVRPGPPLKDYLMKKKSEGYSVVAAEQTSTSVQLQQFKFPKKTLLLLGHEKEGIPCDLLPMMDHCVEIPQQGFVRSLNVHVTAAIFVWEYSRQNIL